MSVSAFAFTIGSANRSYIKYVLVFITLLNFTVAHRQKVNQSGGGFNNISCCQIFNNSLNTDLPVLTNMTITRAFLH